MADIRIKDLASTATTTASDDFMAVDGSTNGTRKMNAAAPAFLTSVTTPTLTSPTSIDLTLAGGSSGASLVLGQGASGVPVFATTNSFSFGTHTTTSTETGVGNIPAFAFRNSSTTANNGAAIRYNSVDSGGSTYRAGAEVGTIFTARTASTLSGALYFATSNAGSFAERMRIAANGDVNISSSTAGSAGAGALVIAGGISAGNSSVASYFGGAVTAAGTLRATNGNLYTYGESGNATDGILYFNSAANNYIYGSGSQLAVYTAGVLRATIASTGATFAGAVTMGSWPIIGNDGNATYILQSAATITAYTAGTSAGTLTNAPSAGNPTKWITINDNGTLRRIPTWN